MFKAKVKMKFEPQEDGRFKFDDLKLKKSLDKNIELMKSIFEGDETLIIRDFVNQNDPTIKCCIFLFNGMINNEIVNENIMKPIMINTKIKSDPKIIDIIHTEVLFSNEVEKTGDIGDIVESLEYGDTILFVDGSDEALIINSKGWSVRSIGEPDAEKALRGSREGFTEGILVNTSLIRRRLKTSDLKMNFKTLGTRTNTKICICYLDSLVDKAVLEELNNRLDEISLDGILDANYIVEYIKDKRTSPFKTVGITERPDTVAGKLLEGRIAIIVDGTPIVITVPYLFIENFQAMDDYSLNFYFSSINRFIRILAFLITTTTPALYVALITFHREMVPTHLILSIAAARQGIPVPTIVECIAVLLVFELIREAGMRMPSNIGQALSIVGALVIGQAAVSAKFISAPMVIIIAITAITGLVNTKISSVTIIFRVAFLLSAAILGLYGMFLTFIGVLIHILSLESFNVEYLSQVTRMNFKSQKDMAFRAPWWKMHTRPLELTKDLVRSKEVGKNE